MDAIGINNELASQELKADAEAGPLRGLPGGAPAPAPMSNPPGSVQPGGPVSNLRCSRHGFSSLSHCPTPSGPPDPRLDHPVSPVRAAHWAVSMSLPTKGLSPRGAGGCGGHSMVPPPHSQAVLLGRAVPATGREWEDSALFEGAGSPNSPYFTDRQARPGVETCQTQM